MRINVIKSSMPPFEEYMEAVRPLWDSVWLTNMGPNHEKLADALNYKMPFPLCQKQTPRLFLGREDLIGLGFVSVYSM